MSSLVDNMQARGGARLGMTRMNRNLARATTWTLICVAILAGYSVAQPCVEPPAREPVCTDCEATDRGAEQPGFKPRLDPGLIPVLEADGIVIDEDDQELRPRWYCFDPEVEVDPVWQGAPLQYTFEVCNLGTANLNVYIKRQ